ncbi:MAG: DUF485 domain-containing protein [Porticoccaceae bacterium]|nr:DUF485 domain-containing protein [Porticoccaceae bacterium]
MNDIELTNILSSKRFKRLVQQRNRMRFRLALMALALHGFFIGGLVLYTDWFAERVVESSSLPVGILAAVFVIVLMVVSQGFYIWYSEKHFDPLQLEISQVMSGNDD